LNPTLEQRWRINLFLSKWLHYCVAQGHSFVTDSQVVMDGISLPEYT
jgi:uncharacterized protein